MSIISPLKAISPLKTEIFRMIRITETRFMRKNTATISAINRTNIGCNIKLLPRPRVTLKDNIVDEILIQQNLLQLQEGVQRMKEIMARKLKECYHAEELIIIDAIQRLGLEYYFHDEIRDALKKHYLEYATEERSHDLHDTALCFRLLRQHGYNVPADTFSKFMDKDGNFKAEVEMDIKGLMSLFEASYLHVPGDHILEYAREFSQHLLRTLGNVEPSETLIIQNTISLPYHKSLPRFMALDFLQNFEISMNLLHDCCGESKWMKEVRKLAQIDINIGQMTIKQEITEICRWWEELRVPEKLKLERNEPIKWHMWSLACLPGPGMGELRLELTKAITFIYIIDDIFDVYGTLEELTLFTETIIRWEYAGLDRLPNYMAISLKALFETTDEISQKIYGKHGFDPKHHIQKVWAEYCKACLVQTKWIASEYTPTTVEYMKNEIATTGSYIVHIHIFFLLGEASIDQRCADHLSRHPDISTLAATILRLWDDLGSSKDENQVRDGSVMACYIHEYEGSSPESAQEYVFAMISDVENRLNEAMMFPSPLSADYKTAIANFAKMIPVMYNYDENHHLPYLEKLMKPLLGANE